MWPGGQGYGQRLVPSPWCLPGLTPLFPTEGERQIPLDGAFLEGSPGAGLRPGEIVLSVFIPYSSQVSPSPAQPGTTAQQEPEPRWVGAPQCGPGCTREL